MEVERLAQVVMETPPFTRFYMGSIILLSASTTVGFVLPSSLLFIPSKAFSYQPWRLITSFLYFGDLLFNLLVHLYFIRRSLGQLENSYTTKLSFLPQRWLVGLSEAQRARVEEFMEANKSVDFFHFVGLVCGGIIAMVTFGFNYRKILIFRLGMILEDVMLFISCKNNPELEFVFLLLFQIRSIYFPYVFTFIQWIFNGDMNNDTRDFPVSFSLGMATLMKSPYLWKFFICFTISHTWWYIHEVLMERVYNHSTTRYSIHQEAIAKVRHGLGSNLVTKSYYELFQIVLLSPPYWKYFWHQTQQLGPD